MNSKSALHNVVVIFLLFVFSLILIKENSYAGAFDKKATIKITHSSQPYSNNNIKRIKNIALGGVTPSYKPDKNIIEKLKILGLSSIRLINVDRKIGVSIKNGEIVSIEWSKKFLDELDICKNNGFIPHIILSQEAPFIISRKNSDGWKHGPTSWKIYQAIVKKYLEYVVEVRGFNASIWEVGNEMDSPDQNWLLDSKMSKNLLDHGYEAYLNLYSNVSSVFRDYKNAHKDKEIYLGGPAFTQFSLLHPDNSKHNWLMRFASDIIKYDLDMDFFSFHYYGNVSTGLDFLKSVNSIKNIFKSENVTKPIWITEWGTSFFSNEKGKINFTEYAGSYGLDFVNKMYKGGISKALFLAARKFPDKNIPTLLDSGGLETDMYKALKLINDIQGQLLECNSNLSEVNCIAYRDNNVVKVIVWYIDWMNNKTLHDFEFYRHVRRDVLVMLDFGSKNNILFKSLYMSNAEYTGPVKKEIIGELNNFRLPYGSYALISFSLINK